MNIEGKKNHILRCVKLGMELFQAELVAECSVEDIEKIEEDKSFLREVKNYFAYAEFALLEKHNNAMELQLIEGRTTAAQWKLERMNPRRWGREDSKQPPELPNLSVNLKGVFPKADEPKRRNNRKGSKRSHR